MDTCKLYFYVNLLPNHRQVVRDIAHNKMTCAKNTQQFFSIFLYHYYIYSYILLSAISCNISAIMRYDVLIKGSTIKHKKYVFKILPIKNNQLISKYEIMLNGKV